MGSDEQNQPTGAEPTGREPAGTGYVTDQMAKAFVTALSHADPEVQANAERRVSRWRAVLDGIASGRIRVGSRTPVAGWPAWVSLEVVRGGFATGQAAAAGPLTVEEVRAADQLGAARHRRDLFAAALTEPGLAHLHSILESGRYRIDLPEEAVLLTVAWLVEAGDIDGALGLVEAVAPYADQLRFWPADGEGPEDLEVVSRATVADVRTTLSHRQPNARVETMREALTVWNPFGDDLVSFWQLALGGPQVPGDAPAEPTAARAAHHDPTGGAPNRNLEHLQRDALALHERYLHLAATHTRCTKHRKPKENLAVLVVALLPFATTGVVPPRVPHAVNSIVRRRGEPGSPEHTARRDAQASNAAVPGIHQLAQVVVERLAHYPANRGVTDIDPLVDPVSAVESAATALPSGAPIHPSVSRTLRRAIEAPVDDLLARGLVPSAEVLATLVPPVAAAAVATDYPDHASQWLAAQSYLAFRNRRSLLLLNLDRQVKVGDLPWVTALARHRRAREDRSVAHAAFTRVAQLTVVGFPATTIPNPMVRELDTLAREAGLRLPFVEELAADIFMGAFTAKFLRAARIATDLLTDSLYARYYEIGYRAVAALEHPDTPVIAGRQSPFGALCHARAGEGRTHGWSVAANGAVIEQAQILTTQNLATLIGPGGLGDTFDEGQWTALAQRCFATVTTQVERVHQNPRPLGTVKDAAYAWRHMVLFLSMTEPARQADTVRAAGRELSSKPAHVRARLGPALTGLRHVVDGGALGDSTCPPGARQFLGWATDGHWMVRAVPTGL